MSAVDTLRDIPVIVEHRRGCKGDDYEPMDFDYDYDSGFPFDNSGRRTRDPLEDIAQRHPEFAQHLQGFPRRSQRSAGDQDNDEFLRRRFERPFSSGRFERFGFPFDRDDFEREPQRYYEAYPEHFEDFQNQNPQTPPQNQTHFPQQQSSSSQTTPQGYQQHPPQYSQEYNPLYNQQQQSQHHPPQYQTQPSQSVSQGTQTEVGCQTEEEPAQQQQEAESESQDQKVENGQTRGRPIQQSNTCDLAQHLPEEALNEREQRSMSAPPENKRFSSSVNIPMGGHQDNNNPSGGGAKSQASSGSTERVIPIHVEGRDDPVMPKNFSGPAPSQQHQPQAERVFSESPRPQPETIFGRRPEAFTQFVNRDPHRFPNDWPHSFGGFPEEEFGFRQTESPSRFGGAKPQQHSAHPQQQQQQQHRQEAPPPSHSQKQPPQPQEQQKAPEPPKQPQPQKQPLGPIEQIQAIQKDVSTLLRQVEAFNGAPRDKNYLYLDEMLTRNLLKLDNVDTQGQDSIRSARKEAIKCIERTISLLEAKAAANVAPKENKMEVEQPQQPQSQGEKMETEASAAQEPSAMEMSPPPTQNDTTTEVNSEASQEASSKSGEGEAADNQPKSVEAVENVKGQTKKEEEVKSEEQPQKTEDADVKPSVEEAQVEEPKKEESAEVKTQVKEGEKKEKKKIKKKVNKEDKEKKQ